MMADHDDKDVLGSRPEFPGSLPSGESFFLDLADIQHTIDERFSDEEKTTEVGVEARETLVVSLKGTLTAQHQPALRRYFDTRIHKSKMRRLVLDLAAVAYMDSSAIGVLVWVRKTLSGEDGQLKVIANAKIYEVLEALQMVDYLGVRLGKGEASP